jgi:hypothetical protein
MAQALQAVVAQFKLAAAETSNAGETQPAKPVLHQTTISHVPQGGNGRSPVKTL